MMGILGLKRIVLLLGLLGINAALAAGLYAYLIPEEASQQAKLRKVRGEVSMLRSDIDKLSVEFAQLEKQKEGFEILKRDGFFKNQSRRQAENTFNLIQKRSGVGKAVAKISAGVVEDNVEAQKAKYKVLKSPIELELEAVTDVDIYHYMYLIDSYFPGHITLENLTLRREADVSGTVLRAIAAGSNPPLVKAKMDLIWRTMIPESEVIGAAPETAATEGGPQ